MRTCWAWAGTQSWLGSGRRECCQLSLLWPRAASRRWLQTPSVRRPWLMCLPLRQRTHWRQSSATGKSHLPVHCSLHLGCSPLLHTGCPVMGTILSIAAYLARNTYGKCVLQTHGICVCEVVRLTVRVAMRAMSSLQEAHEAILQFLEAARQGNVDASNPIILAAIRSLGR
jgi:hypothetical protein